MNLPQYVFDVDVAKIRSELSTTVLEKTEPNYRFKKLLRLRLKNQIWAKFYHIEKNENSWFSFYEFEFQKLKHFFLADRKWHAKRALPSHGPARVSLDRATNGQPGPIN